MTAAAGRRRTRRRATAPRPTPCARRRTTTPAARDRARPGRGRRLRSRASSRRTPTSTSCWCTTTASTRRRWPRRSGTRSGTPARSSTTRSARPREMLERGRRRPPGRARAARPAAPRRRPEPDAAAAVDDAGPLAPRRPRPGCPSCASLVAQAPRADGRARPRLGARPQGGRGRAARRDRAQGAGRDLARRRPARRPRALPAGAARRPRRCSTHAPGGPPTGSRPELWAPLAERLGLADDAAAQLHVRELGRRITHLSRLTWRRVDAVLARPDVGAAARRPDLAPVAPGHRAVGRRGGAHPAGRAPPRTR